MKTCEFCKREVEVLTRHSIMGRHKSPYIKVCRICHDKIHGMKPISKTQRIELKKFLLKKLNESGIDLSDTPILSNKGLK
jgi:hypothetical protein